MATGWDVVKERARQLQLDKLQAEVAEREDQFLIDAGDYGVDDHGEERWIERRPELNEAAIAEWAYGLLERQRESIMGILEDELTTKGQA